MSGISRKISDLFSDVKIGGTPSRGNPAYFGGGRPWVSIKDMQGQPLIETTSETLSDEGVRNSNCKLVRAGSLLFSFKLTVGRVAFAGVDLYTNEAIAAFDAVEAEESGIDLSYLSFVLPMVAQKDSTKNSMGVSLLNKRKILKLEIPFPEISIQSAVATRLTTQFAEVQVARHAGQAQMTEIESLWRQLLVQAFAF
jgi:type I restriction enzyme S subunit